MNRLALSIPEACEALGVGETYFREKVLPDLRVIRRGRRTLIQVVELEGHCQPAPLQPPASS